MPSPDKPAVDASAHDPMPRYANLPPRAADWPILLMVNSESFNG
jgi:hypothetical protein